jgi:hypothetical protein
MVDTRDASYGHQHVWGNKVGNRRLSEEERMGLENVCWQFRFKVLVGWMPLFVVCWAHKHVSIFSLSFVTGDEEIGLLYSLIWDFLGILRQLQI